MSLNTVMLVIGGVMTWIPFLPAAFSASLLIILFQPGIVISYLGFLTLVKVVSCMSSCSNRFFSGETVIRWPYSTSILLSSPVSLITKLIPYIGLCLHDPMYSPPKDARYHPLSIKLQHL